MELLYSAAAAVVEAVLEVVVLADLPGERSEASSLLESVLNSRTKQRDDRQSA